MPDSERPSQDDLAYVKYSAKELLYHQAQQLTKLQEDLTNMKTETTNSLHLIKVGMTSFVTRQEMTNTRRWAIGAVLMASGSVLGMLRLLGI